MPDFNDGESRPAGTRSRTGTPVRNSDTPRRAVSPARSRLRSRSRSPGPNLIDKSNGPRGHAASGSDDSGDSDDDIDDRQTSSMSIRSRGRRPQTNARRAARERRLAEGGLNIGERPTPGRIRNPSKYTDKSMHTNLDRSAAVGNARRRMADGLPREVNAICTNRLGKVRMCKRLLTPMNFRRLYLRLDYRIPRNLLMALTLDVSDNRLRTLDPVDVTTYYFYAARYLRTSLFSADDELLNSDLAVRWLMNAIQILGSLHLCVGNTTMSEAIDEKYRRDLGVNEDTLGAMIRRTVEYTDERPLDHALASLRNLVDVVKPTDIRIWGMDDDGLINDPQTPKYNPNVFLGEARTNELRTYPLAEKKSYVQNFAVDD